MASRCLMRAGCGIAIASALWLASAGCAPQGSSDSAGEHSGADSQLRRSSRLAVTQPESGAAQASNAVPATDPGVRFTDVHRESGLEFQYENGTTGKALMVESTGGGAGWLDYDADGLWDLYFVQGGDPVAGPAKNALQNVLYRNLGGGRFVEVTRGAAVGDTGYGQGLAVGDFDNDGLDDIYVTNYGSNVLYHNQGDGTYQDVTTAAQADDPRWSTSAAWGDINRDGHLDLFVCNYLRYDVHNPIPCLGVDGKPRICHPQELDPLPDECFLNLGDGTFRRVADEWGLQGPGSKSLGVVIADFNGDRWPDIYVANDTAPNFLFVNHSASPTEPRFEESALALGCAVNIQGLYQASMGVAFGDFDHNGWPDLYVTHFTNDSNTLYANYGPSGFHDVTRGVGLHQPTLKYLGFGTVMADFNQDGAEELFVTNGHIDDWRDKGDLWHMPPQLFTFDGKLWHECGASAGPFFQEQRLGRGVAAADYDNDGDWDLAIAHQQSPAALLRNDSQRGHWLKLRFRGHASNRRGVGTRVVLRQGETVLTEQLAGGTSYCAAHEPALIFGLGKTTTPCELQLEWPSGKTQILRDIAIDQTLTLEEPAL